MCEGAGDVHDLTVPAAAGGRLRALDGRAKAILAGAALAANLAASSALGPLLLALGALALVAHAGVPIGSIVRRLCAPWYFATVAFAVQLFFFGQTALFTLGPLTATEEGLARGVLLASKMVGGTAVVLALSLTTPMVELLAVASWLRVPPVLVEIACLIYRYLFLLVEEAARIREAQIARLGYAGWRRALVAYGQLGGLVLINAYGRAERVYEAMLLRGYRGVMPVETNVANGWQLATCAQVGSVIVAIFLLGMVL